MVLEAQNLSYQWKGKALIKDMTLSFRPGILYAIIGPNGSGKSTFLKTLAGIWTLTSGQVLWNQTSLFQYSRLEMSKIISLVPQQTICHFDFTVEELVTMGCYSHSYPAHQEREIVEEKLKSVDAWHLRHCLLSQVSGGERQRAYIARALATEAPVLLLDEPTAHLDLRHQLEVWKLLKYLISQGKVVLVATHDLLAAKRFCDHFTVLDQGHCVRSGSFSSLLESNVLKQVFGITLTDQNQLVTAF